LSSVSDASDLLVATDIGLTCPRGGFVIDPRRGVELALLTHGHADHARRGSSHYVATRTSLPLLRHRLAGASVEGLAYGELASVLGIAEGTVKSRLARARSALLEHFDPHTGASHE